MKKLSLILILLFTFCFSQAQEPRFIKEIRYFKKLDSLQFPPKNAILFIGSSSFTMWKDVATYFPNHTIINRGFGGSSLPDVINYTPDIVFPYQPKQVVIYCGENDFTAAGGIESSVVVNRVKELVALIRTQYPKIPIAFVSIKPSPSREKFFPKMKEANAAIKKWMKKKKRNLQFINVFDAMFNDDGSLKDIYLEDKLHMNSKGYEIWRRAILPVIL